MVSMSNFPSREKPIWTSGRKTAIHIGPAAAPTQRTTRQLYIATILDLHDQFEFATRRLSQLGYISFFFLVNHRFQIPKPKSTESANSSKKKAPKGAFTILISDNQSGESRSGPERAACPPAISLIDREFRTQRRPLNVAFVLRRTARAGNQIYCGRARGPTCVTTAQYRRASPSARQSQCRRTR